MNKKHDIHPHRGSGNPAIKTHWTEQKFKIRPHSRGSHGVLNEDPPWKKFKYPEIKDERS